MFSRKPQTALTAKREMARNHKSDRNNSQKAIMTIKPVNGYTNVNGILMPF